MTKTEKCPEVRVKPHDYQPSKAELNEGMSINASPDDLAYIDQWSLWLDAKILLATVPVAVLGKDSR